MSKKKWTIEDIFNSDDFGLLNVNESKPKLKTDDDRLIDAFEEINTFFDEHGREPSSSKMSELSLLSKLKNFKEDEEKKVILKPFDRHNLLGHVEIERESIDDILSKDSDLLDLDNDLDIFKYKNIPKETERAETDFVAKRKSMKEKDFKRYEKMFYKVHQELKDGSRKLMPFKNIEKNLIVGNYYIMDGILLYLESADLKKEEWVQKSGNRVRIEGRTHTIFENGTYSNMLYRSLGKQIQKSGKLITNTNQKIENQLFVNSNLVNEDDIEGGWIYIGQTKSKDARLSSIKNLYKIGFSSTPVQERIKNAVNEATYLFADVHIVATYQIYNRNALKLEELLDRIFGEVCLDIDIETKSGRRIRPREWFIAPLEEIEKAIELIVREEIMEYRYDKKLEKIVAK